mmetsp:Transcript_5360/g.7878  ORF Transcript_5360/g.7878 Transcript_5360/m.7878 type:complete len:90 (-) Transcript_5360:88-357(-)
MDTILLQSSNPLSTRYCIGYQTLRKTFVKNNLNFKNNNHTARAQHGQESMYNNAIDNKRQKYSCGHHHFLMYLQITVPNLNFMNNSDIV